MANLIQYNGKDKWMKRVCELLNTVAGKITDVKVNGESVIDAEGVAQVSVPELGDAYNEAYPGDLGKEAHDHAMLTSGNPHHVTLEDLGIGDIKDQIRLIMETIGMQQNWADYQGTIMETKGGDEIMFKTSAKILAYK